MNKLTLTVEYHQRESSRKITTEMMVDNEKALWLSFQKNNIRAGLIQTKDDRDKKKRENGEPQ